MKKTFVNSLPKSGTNLLAECLQLFGYKDAGHIGSGYVLSSTPVAKLRRLLLHPIRQGYIVGIDTPVELPRWAVERFIGQVKNDYFITAHVGYTSDLLQHALTLGFSPIVITRDPRAVLASFVPYVVGKNRHPLNRAFNKLTLEDRYMSTLEGMNDGEHMLQPLRVRCNALDPWINSEHVLSIKFEDLVGSKGGGSDNLQMDTLHRICKWIDAPESKIQSVADELFGPGDRYTFRKGKIDSWKNEIPPSVMNKLESSIGDILTKWNYI